jgi:hypothetical protein
MSEEHPTDLSDEDYDDGEYDSDGALKDMFTGGNRVGWSASMSDVTSFAMLSHMFRIIVGFSFGAFDDFVPVGQTVLMAGFHTCVSFCWLDFDCGHIQFSWFCSLGSLACETGLVSFLTSESTYVNYSTITYEISSYWEDKRLQQRLVKIVEKHFIHFCVFADFFVFISN